MLFRSSKLAAENLITAYAQNFEISYNILRYFSVYGPSQRPDMAIQRFLIQMLSEETIEITGDGSQKRDLTFVGDIVDGTISASLSKVSGKVFNLSGGVQYSIIEILQACERVLDCKARIKFVPRPQGDQEETFGNHSEAYRELSFIPKVGLDEGISKQVNWLKTYGIL